MPGEKNSVTNKTVLSLRPADYQFYKNEDKLVLDRLLEPVPVANNNRMVMRSQAYMAVLDWLALQSISIEEIQSRTLVLKDELSERPRPSVSEGRKLSSISIKHSEPASAPVSSRPLTSAVQLRFLKAILTSCSTEHTRLQAAPKRYQSSMNSASN